MCVSRRGERSQISNCTHPSFVAFLQETREDKSLTLLVCLFSSIYLETASRRSLLALILCFNSQKTAQCRAAHSFRLGFCCNILALLPLGNLVYRRNDNNIPQVLALGNRRFEILFLSFPRCVRQRNSTRRIVITFVPIFRYINKTSNSCCVCASSNYRSITPRRRKDKTQDL